MKKIERIKEHVKNNKKTYITGGVCLITGALITLAFTRRVKIEQVIAEVYINGDSNKVIFTKRISKYGIPLGRPGNPVYELDPATGKVIHEYANQLLAAKDAGVSPETFRKHLNGERPHVRGREFMKIGAMEFMEEIHREEALFDY